MGHPKNAYIIFLQLERDTRDVLFIVISRLDFWSPSHHWENIWLHHKSNCRVDVSWDNGRLHGSRTQLLDHMRVKPKGTPSQIRWTLRFCVPKWHRDPGHGKSDFSKLLRLILSMLAFKSRSTGTGESRERRGPASNWDKHQVRGGTWQSAAQHRHYTERHLL